MALQIVALLFIIGAIALGFVKKINVGIVCLGLSLILGKLGGMGAGDIYKGFPYKLFATLLGTMLFFSLLQQNGTLEKISKRLIGACGKNTFLIPIIMYVVSFVLSAAGPGAISVQSVTIIFAVSLAVQMKVSPILMGAMATLGAVGGTASPIALTGIIVGDLLTEAGVEGLGNSVFLGVAACNLFCTIIVYIAFGGYKLRAEKVITSENEKEHFDKNQRISLIALIVMVIMVVGFSYDVGLVCLSLSLILMLARAANEKQALKMIPWNVLVLIAGVSVLMNITQKLGGIDLLSAILASFMSRRTAAPIMGLTGGIMSWFSSANGVVFPTLTPMLPEIAEQVGDVSILNMVVVIICSATVAGISPLSTSGSLIMASYAQETNCDEKVQQKMFGTLFALSASLVGLVFIINLVGLLSFIG
jgi:di/tricarboxylate transporter